MICIKTSSDEHCIFSRFEQPKLVSSLSDKHARHAIVVEIKIRIIDIACEPWHQACVRTIYSINDDTDVINIYYPTITEHNFRVQKMCNWVLWVRVHKKFLTHYNSPFIISINFSYECFHNKVITRWLWIILMIVIPFYTWIVMDLH
jgi:hypothetical protein